MSQTDWTKILGWGESEIEDLRFVGFSYLKQGKYDIALTFFQALIVLQSGNAYDLQTLGAIYLEQNNNLMALNYLEQALKIAPNHPLTLLNRAKALFGLGYKRQALAQALSLEKNSDPAIADQAASLVLAYS